MLLRDSVGRAVGLVDGERLRDMSGKVIASRYSSDDDEYRLARIAAFAMNRRVSDAHRPTAAQVHACRDREERQVLLDLGIGDVVQPAGQGSVSLGENDSGCIADIVSPVRLVPRDRGYLWTENAADIIRLVLPNESESGPPAFVNPSYTKLSFTTRGRALAAKIPVEVGMNADFDLKAQTVRYLVELLRLAREARIANTTLNAANWLNTVAAEGAWDGNANAAPLTDIFAALPLSYLPATTLVLPELAEQYLFTDQHVRDFVQAGGQLPRIVRARARYRSSGALVYAWAPSKPANVALVRTPDDPRKIPTATTLRWLGDEKLDQGQRVDGFFVRTYAEHDGGPLGSEVVVVAANDAELMTSTTTGSTQCAVGALITGAIT